MAELTEYHRLCPICGKMIYHTSKCNRNRLDKLKCLCKECLGKSQRKSKTDMLVRKCPKCNSEIWYNTRKVYNQANKRNSLCKKCVGENRPPCSVKTREKISVSNSGSNNGMYGKTHSMSYKLKLHNKLLGKPLPRRSDTAEKIRITRRKMAAEKFLLLGFSSPRVNIAACKFIDSWGKTNGYNFQHGTNGGEVYFSNVGAFVDGYDRKKNVVFEYDEKHHFDIYGNLKPKDVQRMNDLMKQLKCSVIRYNEKSKKITYYEPQIST